MLQRVGGLLSHAWWLLLLALVGSCRPEAGSKLNGAGRSPSAPAADTVSAGEREAVLAELRTYYRDFSARDWSAYAAHFWPGATLSTIWTPPGEAQPRVMVTTVPEFVRQAPLGPGSQPIFRERMLGADVRVRHNLAHVWAHYEVQFGTPDSLAVWRGIDAFTLMAHGGRWRIVALAYTDE